MRTDGLSDIYSLEEVARAAGVSHARARARAGHNGMLPAREALRLGRLLVADGLDELDSWLAVLALPLAADASVLLLSGPVTPDDADMGDLIAHEKVTATAGR